VQTDKCAGRIVPFHVRTCLSHSRPRNSVINNAITHELSKTRDLNPTVAIDCDVVAVELCVTILDLDIPFYDSEVGIKFSGIAAEQPFEIFLGKGRD
jgi:hypothetical protein